jgi:hypothetical protein
MCMFDSLFGQVAPGGEFSVPNPAFDAMASCGGPGYYAFIKGQKLHPPEGGWPDGAPNAVVDGRLVRLADDAVVVCSSGGLR